METIALALMEAIGGHRYWDGGRPSLVRREPIAIRLEAIAIGMEAGHR